MSDFVAYLSSAWARGSRTNKSAPLCAAFFIKVAATGWFTAGFAPITIIESAYSTCENDAVTAPEPIFSSNAATEEAWHSRVQWSTLLV